MSEGLAQGPYMAAGVGFEPATIWTQGTEITEPPPPCWQCLVTGQIPLPDQSKYEQETKLALLIAEHS